MPQTETTPVNPEELSDVQKIRVEALMDYIATTPQNINYNIIREISKAVILNENHPYFDYYVEKIESKETEESSKDFDDGKEVSSGVSEDLPEIVDRT